MKTYINSCSLDRLFLDPNNYRFIDNENYEHVTPDRIMDVRVQQNTLQMLLGKSRENVIDLINSFRTNGYVNLESVQVKAIDDCNYLVIEGNRRVATLKYLYEQYHAGVNIGAMELFDFQNVPITVISDSIRAQIVAMGINHIGGKKRWNPYNQAQMIYDLNTQYNMTIEEICNSLGVTKYLANKSLRTLALIRAYQESDYGDQFKSEMYSFFEEAIKSTAIKDWLDWDNESRISRNKRNEERLFSWFSKTEDDEEDEEGVLVPVVRNPIITKSSEIRDLSKFIDDDKALARMEDTRSVNDGFAISDAIGRSRIETAIDNINSEMKAMLNYAEYLKEDDLDKMNLIVRRFQKSRAESTRVTVTGKSSFLFEKDNTHFESVLIHQYRGIKELKVENLNRINIFVGFNNSGKTMLLEAIYLLTQMNNIRRCLDLEKFRSKILEDTSSKWLAGNMPELVSLEGVFNNKCYKSIFEKMPEESMDINKQGYITTLTNESFEEGGQRYEAKIQLYDDAEDKHYYNRIVALCPSLFTSPYFTNKDRLVYAHRRVVELGRMETLIDFMRKYIDGDLDSIRLVDSDDPVKFVVTKKGQETGLDLTKCGEGMQRVFEISLYLLSCASGCVFIDEIDSGIHKTLLDNYIAYISDLADMYDVQLFVSTHSKECVDAFVNNCMGQNMSAFRLERTNADEITIKYTHGVQLKTLVDNFDLDIRL